LSNEEMILKINNIEVKYHEVILVLKGVSLSVPKGEIVALLGANGAGKTTTLNTLAGLLPPAAGDIRYQGARINTLAAHQRVRRGLALVPEGRGIFTRLSVAENLRMGAYARRDTHAIAADLERVCALLPRIGERLEQLAGTLSGGEQQRVGIARAVVNKPLLLLADEPTGNLDPKSGGRVQELILELNRERGLTSVIVTHNLEMARVLDRQITLLDGKALILQGE